MSRKYFSNRVVNAVKEVCLHTKLTFAADVAAGGVAVTEGSGYVASVARTAEGVFTLTLTERYAKFLNAHFISDESDTMFLLTDEAVKASKTLEFTTEVAGTDTDPDGAVVYVTLWLSLSNA